jgi:hypothetical protein
LYNEVILASVMWLFRVSIDGLGWPVELRSSSVRRAWLQSALGRHKCFPCCWTKGFPASALIRNSRSVFWCGRKIMEFSKPREIASQQPTKGRYSQCENPCIATLAASGRGFEQQKYRYEMLNLP